MDFEQVRSYLDKALAFGIRPGLGRMERLMELLGNPQNGLRHIHIAGTNGKGSVSNYCASILAAAGLKTGLYTSPYLERLTERIRVIDGRAGLEQLAKDETAGEISNDEFAADMTLVSNRVEQMLSEGFEHPTEFELITAVGFLHFAGSGCDVVVLETGLGGRLDSTNLIRPPLACIITALGYDHMDRLGGTMAEIASEKAGIIKAGSPVYLYDPAAADLSAADAAAARKVIEDRCTAMSAPLHLVRQAEITPVRYGWAGQAFVDHSRGLFLETSLLGLFQPLNAVLAARVCRDLKLADDKAVRDGIRVARWPARLEILRSNPPVLLDGCHNPQGCQALAGALNRLLPGKPVVFLAGIFQDKDSDGMIRAILEHAEYCPAAFVCTAPESPRALPAGQLAEKVARIAVQLPKPAHCGYNVLDAIHVAGIPAEAARLALRLAGRQGMALCAFGSLHLAGSVRGPLSVKEDQIWTGSS